MKTAAIICPEDRAQFDFLARATPLALIPYCGKHLLDHSLTELAQAGYTNVQIHLSDRPEAIRNLVGNGEKWGLSVTIHPNPSEISPDTLRRQFAERNQEATVFTVDRIPLTHPSTLFANYETWFQSIVEYMPIAGSMQANMNEREPGVWVGTGTQLSENVTLTAPCWIGRNVLIAKNARIGPNAIIEDQCFIDEDSVVEHSQVGSRTYVGSKTDVRNSFAWGGRLLNWHSENGVEVLDRFLLAQLGGDDSNTGRFRPRLRERFFALLFLLVSTPLLLVMAILLKATGKSVTSRHKAIVPQAVDDQTAPSYFTYTDLNSKHLRLRRLLRLWSVVKGDMTWIGNPPLPPTAGRSFETEFDRLWFAAPVGVVSLGDCYGCIDPTQDEARAHATYFAVQTEPEIKRKVYLWLFLGKLTS